MQISTIPRLKERVEIMLFRRRFEILLSELMPDLGILHSAAIEIKASQRLREVLKVSPRLWVLSDLLLIARRWC